MVMDDTELKTELRAFMAESRAGAREILKMIARHDRLLVGRDGDNGLVVMVDRLAQAEKRRVWHLRALWGAALAGLANVASGFLGIGKGP